MKTKQEGTSQSFQNLFFSSNMWKWISHSFPPGDELFLLLFKAPFFWNDAVSPDMAPGWVVLFLLVGVCGALEDLQTCNLSQRCTKDIDTFLWEINQDKPKEYAVLSKFCYLLQDVFPKILSLFFITSSFHQMQEQL